MATLSTAEMGGLTCRVVAATGPVRGAVVFLHGFGAPGDDLVGLAEAMDLPTGTLAVFPHAPIALAGMMAPGRAWWMIDLEQMQLEMLRGGMRDRRAEVPVGLAEARGGVLGVLDALPERFGVDPGRIVLGGFSQGAMLSLDVALHRRPNDARSGLAGLVLWSGTLIAEAEWAPRFPRLAGLPVYQSHGRRDPLLPFPAAEELADRLRSAGARLEWHAFSGGHEIPPPVLAGSNRIIQLALP